MWKAAAAVVAWRSLAPGCVALQCFTRAARRQRCQIAGIDTSCDDTAVAVVTDGTIDANIVWSQHSQHSVYGGVVPTLAGMAHDAALPLVWREAMSRVQVSTAAAPALSVVAVTVGPGLGQSLAAGIGFARQQAAAAGALVVPVNHLEAHALSARIEATNGELAFPYLALIASGGHTLLVLVRGVGDYLRLASTTDDSIGEAFDKVARLLRTWRFVGNGPDGVERLSLTAASSSLLEAAIDADVAAATTRQSGLLAGYRQVSSDAGGRVSAHLGALLERLADLHSGDVDPRAPRLVLPVPGRNNPPRGAVPCTFTFSGLKAAVARLVTLEAPTQADAARIAAAFQRAAVLHVVDQTSRALAFLRCWSATGGPPAPTALAIVGGVARNSLLREALSEVCRGFGIGYRAPSAVLCADNGAMVAWAAWERLISVGALTVDTGQTPNTWRLCRRTAIAKGAAVAHGEELAPRPRWRDWDSLKLQ